MADLTGGELHWSMPPDARLAHDPFLVISRNRRLLLRWPQPLQLWTSANCEDGGTTFDALCSIMERD